MASAFPKGVCAGALSRYTGLRRRTPISPQFCSSGIKSGHRRTTHSSLHRIDTNSSISSIPELPSSYSSLRSPLPVKSSRYPSSTERPAHSPQYDPSRAPAGPSARDILHNAPLSQHLRDTLPLFAAQTPHYASIHIHGKPYLVTEGDTLRLPFLMHGVGPGDVLRLNRVTRLGSREWTLCNTSKGTSVTQIARQPELTNLSTPGNPKAEDESLGSNTQSLNGSPHLQDESNTNLQKTTLTAYLDERLYTLRAVVMGTESEPLRIKMKKKQRNRHTKTVKSKHRFTILKIKELDVVTEVSEAVRAI